MVDGKLPVGEALKRIGYVPKSKIHQNLGVQAWATELLGHAPEEEEEFCFENIDITVDETEEGSASKFVFKLNVTE